MESLPPRESGGNFAPKKIYVPLCQVLIFYIAVVEEAA
jgi:hypothetical protein